MIGMSMRKDKGVDQPRVDMTPQGPEGTGSHFKDDALTASARAGESVMSTLPALGSCSAWDRA